jgi:TolB-like protein/Flp pilus assembly protein TadD
MGTETPNQVATTAQAVFLSYASQDADAACRISDALRAEGIEVWFDQSELRGGDVWDQKIRREIRDCALFIPVISTNTASRREGYFRLEWDIADQRSHRMARDQAFIVPVCLDATPGAGSDVPESFHRVQWTRLPDGETPSEFVARIKRLLSPDPPSTARLSAGPVLGASPIPRTTGQSSPLRRALFVAVALLVLAALAYLLINKPWISKPAATLATSNATSSPGAPPAAFNPPPHSIAVLPFVNMSGDKEQDYFSDGLSEELLNDLARINELQVAARTSAFSFKGKDADIGTIARKLNVGAVLEGSVRRSGRTIRITAQLNNAVTGFHMWSQTYDRDLGDVLQLQTEIATAVAGALKVTLLGEATARMESGGTRNPAALDAYLRAMKLHFHTARENDEQVAVAAYSESISLDPNYALAFAGRSLAHSARSGWLTGPAMNEELTKAQADAHRAIALAPELAEGHLALAAVFENALDFARAATEYESALVLAPGNARVLRDYGDFEVFMGRSDTGIAAVRRAAALDPLNPVSRTSLASALMYARRYDEALKASQEAITLDPASPLAHGLHGWASYALGDLNNARSSCEAEPNTAMSYSCLAVIYEKLGRHADSHTMLTKLQAEYGDASARTYAAVYALLGNVSKALEWLETAYRVRSSELETLKTDPAFDPLRNEPRFQAIERALKFPD